MNRFLSFQCALLGAILFPSIILAQSPQAPGVDFSQVFIMTPGVLFMPKNNPILVNALEQDLPCIKLVIQQLNSP